MSDATHCPVCEAPLPAHAVLCVACGYHLATGTMLATHVEREPSPQPPPPSSDNPYASPALAEPVQSHLRATPEFDLTESGARRAKAIAADGEGLAVALLLGICCAPPAAFMILPWYAYRLWSWHQLNSQFSELRHPNAFSPHSQTAIRFQDVRQRLLLGVIIGAVYFGIGTASLVVSLARLLHN